MPRLCAAEGLWTTAVASATVAYSNMALAMASANDSSSTKDRWLTGVGAVAALGVDPSERDPDVSHAAPSGPGVPLALAAAAAARAFASGIFRKSHEVMRSGVSRNHVRFFHRS